MSPNTVLEREGGLPQGREMFPQTISDAGEPVSRLARSVAGKRVFASCRNDFGASKFGPPKAHNQFHKSVCIAVLHVTHLDSEV